MSTVVTSPAPSLSDAITGVESALTAYANASATIVTDQGNISSAQAKLDTANNQLAADLPVQTAAGDGVNSALGLLITAAQAAMVPGSAPSAS